MRDDIYLPAYLLVSLDNLSAFPCISSFELHPIAHGPGLDADHVLPAVFRGEVGHSFCFFVPQIPHGHIWKGISGDGEFWFAIFQDC